MGMVATDGRRLSLVEVQEDSLAIEGFKKVLLPRESMSDPVPSGDDFRVTLSAEEQARIAREIDANVRQSLTRGTEDLWKRLRDVSATWSSGWGPRRMVMEATQIKMNSPIPNPWFVKYLIPQIELAEPGTASN
jgi:hypothetical protein